MKWGREVVIVIGMAATFAISLLVSPLFFPFGILITMAVAILLTGSGDD